jgi:hypothetical protein
VNNKETKNLIKKARELAKPFRVTDDHFRLKDVDPGATLQFASEDKPREKEALAMGITLMAELQDRLYAQDSWAVLLIFQAMDAAGKDGAIKHVMSGLNPQGCRVFSFKAPTGEELNHDYLWRCLKRLPERGRIGIFIGSYVLAALIPGPGLWLRSVNLAAVADAGLPHVSVPSFLLSFLLFNAGLGVRTNRLWQLARRPTLLAVGVLANLVLPVVFILGTAMTMQLWHNPREAQEILIGLALIASMPVAGSSTAWIQNADEEKLSVDSGEGF